MTYRKKLIEVGLPLVAINAESAREKSIRHGHPSTLHLWWARRPLAACRAVLFASLVDDPDSDPQYRKPDGSVDEDAAGIKRADLFNLIEELVAWENSNNEDIIRSARAEIARCVASRLIETGKLAKTKVIGGVVTAQDLAVRCHCRPQTVGVDKKAGRMRFNLDVAMLPPAEVINAFLAEYAPPVLDPFAGGGSIPLEAQRLGLRAYASDLNPIPVLINKALIEIPAKFAGLPPVNPNSRKDSKGQSAKKQRDLLRKDWQGAAGLAEDVRYYGQWIRDEAETKIGHLYPKARVTEAMAKDRPDLREFVGQDLTVIAWIWARTVASSSPVYQGVHVPLVRGYWLSKKTNNLTWVEPVVDRAARSYRFVVRTGNPTPDQKKAIDVGTKLGRGCKFRCLLSDEPIPEAHIKAEGPGGRLNTTLLAVVAEGPRGRVYLAPQDVPQVTVEKPTNLRGIDAPLANDPRNLWCLGYGLNTFDKLFSSRQLIALLTLSDLVELARDKVRIDSASVNGGLGDDDYADGVATFLAFSLSRSVDRSSTICTWDSSPKMEALRNTFARQAIPMTWDFAEGNPFSESSGNWLNNIEWVAKTIDHSTVGIPGSASQLDATAALAELPSPIVSTDPPYYDNIGYADLSDFFYVWLRRCLGRIYPSILATMVTPKAQELIASPYRHEGSKDKAQSFFEEGFGKAFSRMRAANHSDYPLTVYYAFKQAETENDSEGNGEFSGSVTTASTGWETMLAGLIRSGFGITGTWPMRTELGNRMVGSGTNALASSIVLVCRPRPSNATLATRKEFITALRRELPEALRNLQRGNIAPVDLAQAAIGPGMAVFTRFAKVMESDGSPMSVRTALGLINETLDEVLAEQEGEFESDTRWALSWYDQFGMNEGPFGDAELLSKAKNTAVNGLVEAGVITSRGGKVQLVSRSALPSDWDPLTDKRLTAWETTQHLIRTLENKGEAEAAALLNKLGGIAETARDLAYRLYSISDRKKWVDEALAYNGLVIAWPELSKLALAERSRQPSTAQREMF